MKLGTMLMISALGFTPLLGQPEKGGKDAASIFRQRCSGCHGQDGKAQTFVGKRVHAADLASQSVQQQSDAALSDIIKSGKGKMPAFGKKLSESEIRGLLAYVRQFGSK
jgi:cytochrome c6